MKPRGRQIGQTVNPRDERGWMVPRAGTIRRSVYDALVAGTSYRDVCQSLGISKWSYYGHRDYIMNTAHVYERRRRWA